MKPIHLSLSGLQSYRGKQDIDFTLLCDAGVFGIFGPTGSGKSTILDAMTLALFGKVERASNGTQGIMNQAENTLAVSFTFELGNASGTKRYRVDRQFKRGGDVSVGNTVSRFVQLDPFGEQAEVLADKAADVNQKVLDVLGLSMQDFTRAVVLPQGKFAEFLSLKGSERRQMLQRLFHLETYGDQLLAKLSSRTKETDVQLKQLEAEQAGLGNASSEALEAAEAVWQSAVQAAVRHRSEKEQTEREYETLKQVRDWQTERERLVLEQGKLLQQSELMAERQRQLVRSEQAERLWPLAAELETAESRLIARTDERTAAEASHTVISRQFASANEAYSAARAELAEKQGPLLVRLEKLQQALELSQDIRKHESAETELREALAQKQQLLSDEMEQIAKTEQLQEKAVAKQTALKEELKGVQLSNDLRQQLRQADTGRERLEAHQRTLSERAAEEEAQLREKQSLELSCQRAEGLLNSARAQVQLLLARWVKQAEAVAHAVSAAAAAERLTTAEAERQRREIRERELAQLATRLARELRDGEACPVCGSHDHPGVQSHAPASEADELTVLERELAQRQEAVRACQAQLQTTQHAVKTALSELTEESAGVGMLEAAPTALLPLETPAAAPSIDELERLVKQLDSTRRELEQDYREAKQTLALAEREWNAVSIRMNSQEAASSAATLKRAAAAREHEELLAAWKQQFPQWSPQAAQQLSEEAAGKDAQAAELNKKLDISVEYIEAGRRKLQELREQTSKVEKECVRLQSELASEEQQLHVKREKLHAQTGGSPVQAEIELAAAQLQVLQNAERTTGQSMQQLQAALSECSERLASSAAALQAAQQAKQEAEDKWRTALHAAKLFTSADDVKASRLDSVVREQWTEELSLYEDVCKKLATGIKQLEDWLTGRSVTDEEWVSWQERLRLVREQDEAALQQRARAERDLEELKAKHERWRSLENNRLLAAESLGRLQKLTSVFRGNAFVEFVAEEQLMQVSKAASERLAQLTRGRYALEVDSSGGFVIRDDANGGLRRPVGTLSGGETFLTSLSLALALSAQIQLNGEYPLQFFFLDEGFGTLDPELLETVIHALEKLHMDKLTVGVISHVPELKARLARRLVVSPAEASGRGSRIQYETM